MLFCGRTHWSMVFNEFNVSWSIKIHRHSSRAAPHRCTVPVRTQKMPVVKGTPHSGTSRVIMIPTKPRFPLWLFAMEKGAEKVRSSSSIQRFCSQKTCRCLLSKIILMIFGWFQATSLWLFTNETCRTSFDIFEDFTCKNGEIAICYGSNIG